MKSFLNSKVPKILQLVHPKIPKFLNLTLVNRFSKAEGHNAYTRRKRKVR